ncbi:MAG TPA: hypothetical protein VJT84_12635 [Gaiellaceae bacterium]|nr:hypothetical protein [Gaiellaceae bacterium]
MRRLRNLVLSAAAATAALAVALLLWPGERSVALDAYFLAVGSLALLAVLRVTIGRLPSEQPSPLDEAAAAPEADRPPDLIELERGVELGAQSEFDLYFRLRPRLRRIAAAKLHARGIDLDAGDGEAAAALGSPVWELLRPDRPRPDATGSRARSVRSIEAAVEALERL